MRVLAKTSRMQRRWPKSPTETENPLTLPEPLPTKEEAAKSFEEDEKAEDTKKSTYTMQEQQPKKQTKEQNKRPLSNSSYSSVSNPTKRRININEQELAFLFDQEIDTSSSP